MHGVAEPQLLHPPTSSLEPQVVFTRDAPYPAQPCFARKACECRVGQNQPALYTPPVSFVIRIPSLSFALMFHKACPLKYFEVLIRYETIDPKCSFMQPCSPSSNRLLTSLYFGAPVCIQLLSLLHSAYILLPNMIYRPANILLCSIRMSGLPLFLTYSVSSIYSWTEPTKPSIVFE
jgi:hypothetical protein